MSDNSNNNLPGIKKLTGKNNYGTWKFGMEMFLVSENLWKLVKPDEEGKIDPAKDAKARAKICLMVTENLYPTVKGCKTAKEVWEKLEKTYEDKGLSCRLRYLRKLFKISLSEFSNMENYLNEIQTLTQALAEIGAELEDEFIGVIMLNGLGEEYEPMIMTLEHSGQKITSDKIKNILMQQDSKVNESQDSALAAGNKNRFRNHKYTGKFAGKCFKCGKQGHMKFQCGKFSYNDNQTEPDRTKNHLITQDQSKYKASSVLITALSSVSVKTSDWVVDSGASSHMANNEKFFKNISACDRDVHTANGEILKCSGKGDVKVNDLTIANALYVPDLSMNLLSVSEMTKKGLSVKFSNNKCDIRNGDNKVIATGNKNTDGIYKLNTRKKVECANSVSERIWHCRLGHPCRKSMEMISDLADGVVYGQSDNETCISCIKGKQARLPFKNIGTRATKKLHIVHSDVCGPMSVPSWGGAKYILTFTDDFSRKSWVYMIQNKSEVCNKFKEFKCMVENQSGNKIKILRSDNGREYVNSQLNSFLKNCGIIHQTSVPYTPELNGVSERCNRSLMEKARTMLEEKNLPRQYWAEAVNTANYLKNRTPTVAVKDKLPEEAWTGIRVNLSHLKVFGSTAFMHVPDVKRKKLDSKSEEYIFVGYNDNGTGYRLLNKNNPRELKIARDVIVLEENINKDKQNKNDEDVFVPIKLHREQKYNKEETEKNEEQRNDKEETKENGTQNIDNTEQISDNSNEDSSHSDFLGFDTDFEIEKSEKDKDKQVRRRKRKVPIKFNDYVMLTYKDAMKGPDKQQWTEAIEEELKALRENKTWKLINRDEIEDSKVISNKWIFKIKDDGRYRARLVVRGCEQEEGVDFKETFG